MKRVSLRHANVGATLATLFVALSAEPALAHVDVQPRLVEQGRSTDLRVELPQLRPGAPPKGLEVEGPGVEVLFVRKQASKRLETVWTVRLRASGQPGNVPLVLRALYPAGGSVEVDAAVIVVRAPAGAGFPWPGVIVGAGLAAGFLVIALLVARRKA